MVADLLAAALPTYKPRNVSRKPIRYKAYSPVEFNYPWRYPRNAYTGGEDISSVVMIDRPYTIPVCNWYVSPTGNDSTGTGAIGAPYATIAKVLTVLTAGQSVAVLGAASVKTRYREQITLSVANTTWYADPVNEVILDQTNVLSTWTVEVAGARWRADGITPVLRSGSPANEHDGWQLFIGTSADNGTRRISLESPCVNTDVASGYFRVDQTADSVWIAEDPTGKSVRLSWRNRAVLINASATGTKFYGFHFQGGGTDFQDGQVRDESHEAQFHYCVSSFGASGGWSINTPSGTSAEIRRRATTFNQCAMIKNGYIAAHVNMANTILWKDCAWYGSDRMHTIRVEATKSSDLSSGTLILNAAFTGTTGTVAVTDGASRTGSGSFTNGSRLVTNFTTLSSWPVGTSIQGTGIPGGNTVAGVEASYKIPGGNEAGKKDSNTTLSYYVGCYAEDQPRGTWFDQWCDNNVVAMCLFKNTNTTAESGAGFFYELSTKGWCLSTIMIGADQALKISESSLVHAGNLTIVKSYRGTEILETAAGSVRRRYPVYSWGDIVSGTNTISNIEDAQSFAVGDTIDADGIPSGAVIATITGTTGATITWTGSNATRTKTGVFFRNRSTRPANGQTFGNRIRNLLIMDVKRDGPGDGTGTIVGDGGGSNINDNNTVAAHKVDANEEVSYYDGVWVWAKNGFRYRMRVSGVDVQSGLSNIRGNSQLVQAGFQQFNGVDSTAASAPDWVRDFVNDDLRPSPTGAVLGGGLNILPEQSWVYAWIYGWDPRYDYIITGAPVGALHNGWYAFDDFKRAVASGSTSSWGSAVHGGAWTIGGATSNYSVTNNSGRQSLAANGSALSYLAGISVQNASVMARFTTDKLVVGGLQQNALLLRRLGATATYYILNLQRNTDHSISLVLQKTISGGSTSGIGSAVVVAGLDDTPGKWIWVRFQAVGATPTLLSGKAWFDGTPEPPTWAFTNRSDSDATLQTAGNPGVRSFLSTSATNGPVAFDVRDLIFTDPLP